MKKINLSNLGKWVVPIGLAVGALLGAITDKRKEDKIDELIEKVDKLTTKEE